MVKGFRLKIINTKKLRAFLLFFVFLFSIIANGSSLGQDEEISKSAPEYNEKQVFNIDLRDVFKYTKFDFPELKLVYKTILSKPDLFFPTGVVYSLEGTRTKIGTSRDEKVNALKNIVHSIALEDMITIEEYVTEPVIRNGIYEPSITVLKRAEVEYFFIASIHHYISGRSDYFFRRFNVKVNSMKIKITEASTTEDIPFAHTAFGIKVGLIERKAIIEDSLYNIKMVYPIAVGGINEGVLPNLKKLDILTPELRGAALKKKRAEFIKDKPEYFLEKPFLRISTSRSDWTKMGFHIRQNSTLVRGFLSHGCMRMREKDLYELYTIIRWQGPGAIPLEINYWLDDILDHPYPLENRFYSRVKNFGTKENPEYKREEETDLIILEQIWDIPPVYDIPNPYRVPIIP